MNYLGFLDYLILGGLFRSSFCFCDVARRSGRLIVVSVYYNRLAIFSIVCSCELIDQHREAIIDEIQ